MRRTRLTAAVLGASGYTGGELLRLLDGHPYVTVAHVTADKSVGLPVTSLFPHLETFHEFRFAPMDVAPILQKIDVVFSCLPHTKAMEPVAACVRAKKLVIDLSADFRLTETKTYEQWYGAPHAAPALLKKAAYGLPELHRTRIRRARLVAAPGCYPTAAILQLAPLLAHRLIQPGTIVVDAKSGISGAGRSPGLPYHFPEAHDSLTAYNVARHRHTPEIEQELNRLLQGSKGKGARARVLFTPHLIPMNRGLLSTAYAKLRTPLTNEAATALYKDFYANERFIRIREASTAISPIHVRGSNFCDIGAFVDERTNHVITVSTLDNLVKGAAGQAIQSMNLMMGFPEETALTAPGIFP